MFKSVSAKTATDYFIVAGLIAVSGLPYFMIAQTNFFILFLFAAYIYLKRSVIFDPRMLVIVGSFVVVEFLQLLFIHPFDPVMISGTFIRMFLSIFVVSLVREKFTVYFSNIIYYFSLISFLFFIPSLVIPGFFNFFVIHVCPIFTSPFADKDSFYIVWPTNLIFCFHECVLAEFRNPGPFWEPGLFAVFLNLALIFNLINERKLWTRKNIVLALALISTFSTAGYIAFFVLLFSYYIVDQSLGKKILLTAVLLPVVLTLYFSLEFLSNKVEQNISMASTTTSSRFGSALIDITDFSASPFIGWGRGVMRYGGRSFSFFSEDQHRNNSVTDLLATYGLFIFLFYFFNYYMSLKALCLKSGFNPHFAYFSLLVILILGFSQSIFLKPFFYSLMFLRFTQDEGWRLNETGKRYGDMEHRAPDNFIKSDSIE
jgi:hypothetical protein